MDRTILEQRTKLFHIEAIKLCNDFPQTTVGFETAKQLIRSAGLVGANYRATKRAKSTNDFINKLKIIIEEADESHYWLEIVDEAAILKSDKVKTLIKEGNELTAIFVA